MHVVGPHAARIYPQSCEDVALSTWISKDGASEPPRPRQRVTWGWDLVDLCRRSCAQNSRVVEPSACCSSPGELQWGLCPAKPRGPNAFQCVWKVGTRCQGLGGKRLFLSLKVLDLLGTCYSLLLSCFSLFGWAVYPTPVTPSYFGST